MGKKSASFFNSQPTRDGRIAIIDIGSNSIRLVVYDQQKRSPVPIYNEKVMCALGKGLASSGVLYPEGVELAKHTLKRFIALGRNMEIASLHVMATAAVRDATDGERFASYLERTYKIEVDVISGKKEARLGAYGVCASIYKPKGITGDLGGGSMELVWLDDGAIAHNMSMPLGSLRMIDETKGDRDKLKKLIDKRFSELTWLEAHKVPNFYAIGGSFRALAKMHMAANAYPLSILHEYTVEAKPFRTFLRQVAELPESRIEKLPGASAKRAPAIPGAALVLERILDKARPEKLVFSASGIREGYLYEKLSHHTRKQDGLLASCTEFATKSGRTTAYATELFDWMESLVKKETPEQKRLRSAFCLLTDIALHIHPEYRAEWAFHRIVFSALTGLTHRERVILALALYHRYQSKLKEEWAELMLITPQDRSWAKLMGSIANLGYHISGSIAGNLSKTSLSAGREKITLSLSKPIQDIMGDAVKKRMETLNEAWREFKDTNRI